ncbi:MAG: hypothetical protein RBR68_15905 [Tenuifilaceae bacterium]|nr:hypothetical protein [Tenuifilaceae bacterium]
MKTTAKASLLYEAAYQRYLEGGYLSKLKDFCQQERIYYQGFQEWAIEKGYPLCSNNYWDGQVGTIFKIDIL